jgi:hypothetical protein
MTCSLSTDACAALALERRADVFFSHVRDAASCQRACDEYDGASINSGRAACTAWSLHHGCTLHIERTVVTPSRLPDAGGVSGVARCASPAAVERYSHAHAWAPSALPLVLTHVASFAVDRPIAARIARAHFQLASRGLTHRILLVQGACRAHACDDAALRREDALATALLRAALGASSDDALAPIGERDLERAFPGVLAAHRHWRWADRRQPKWLVNGCDLPALAHVAGARTLPPHVWVLQHDVGWTGQLADVLDAAADAPEEAASALRGSSRPELDAGPSGRDEADLLCLDFARNKSADWPHAKRRNYLRSDEVASCLLPAVRYSARLLGALFTSLRAGETIYCEARAASECARSPWCRVRELRGSGLLGPNSYFTEVNESLLLDRAADACTVGRLYHRAVAG